MVGSSERERTARYDREMRAVLLVALITAALSCMLGGRGPDPVTARPPPDPDRMPSEVLEHQDPGADTSHNPELSRSEANPHPWLSGLFGGCDDRAQQSYSGRETFIGCGSCQARDASGGANVALLMVAGLIATRRRRRNGSSRP